jgi:hypothetical protein
MPASRFAIPVRRICISIAALTAAATAAPAHADPPEPPGKDVTLTHLGELRVAPEGSGEGYSRDKFPHWRTVEGTCNTREFVLRRDGENVQTDSSCRAISGTWRSPYDDGVWTQASDVDIDHMVALAEAWRSGADSWTTDRREDFANDLGSSQLWAVTDNVNQAKGDKDPSEWLPPRTEFHCMYARSWTDVKHRYGLTIDSAEKSALTDLIDRRC